MLLERVNTESLRLIEYLVKLDKINTGKNPGETEPARDTGVGEEESSGWGNEDWGEHDSDWSNEGDEAESPAPQTAQSTENDPLSATETQLLKHWYKNGQAAVSPAGDLVVVGNDVTLLVYAIGSDGTTTQICTISDCRLGETVTCTLCVPIRTTYELHTCILVGYSTGRFKVFSKEGQTLFAQLFHSHTLMCMRMRSLGNSATTHDQKYTHTYNPQIHAQQQAQALRNSQMETYTSTFRRIEKTRFKSASGSLEDEDQAVLAMQAKEKQLLKGSNAELSLLYSDGVCVCVEGSSLVTAIVAQLDVKVGNHSNTDVFEPNENTAKLTKELLESGRNLAEKQSNTSLQNETVEYKNKSSDDDSDKYGDDSEEEEMEKPRYDYTTAQQDTQEDSSEPSKAPPLEYVKWQLTGQEQTVDIISLPPVQPDVLEALTLPDDKANAPIARHLSVGREPCSALYNTEVGDSHYTHVDLGSAVASKVASAVFSLAKRWGMRGRNSNAGPVPAQLEAAKPLTQVAEANDPNRTITSISPDPKLMYAALSDNLGRVILCDMTRLVYLRVWKGYREAQCGWIEVTEETEQDTDRPARTITLLVMLAPRRKLLEIWRVLPTCVRLYALDIGPYARLITSIHTTLDMGGKAFTGGSKRNSKRGGDRGVANAQPCCYVLRGTGVLETVSLTYAEATEDLRS